MEKIRSGEAEWFVRDHGSDITERGILFSHREKDAPAGGPGHEELIEGLQQLVTLPIDA